MHWLIMEELALRAQIQNTSTDTLSVQFTNTLLDLSWGEGKTLLGKIYWTVNFLVDIWGE